MVTLAQQIRQQPIFAPLRSLFLTLLASGGMLTPAQAGFLDSWEETIPRGKSLGGITYADGRFVMAGGYSELLISSNLVTWQRESFPPAHFIQDLTYGNGVFVAVGSVTNQIGMVLRSPNAKDWTSKIVSPTRLDAVAFGKGVFVAIGNDTILTSVDGIGWASTRPTPFIGLRGVDFVDEHFVALGSRGLTLMSMDGYSWSMPTNDMLPDLLASAHGDGTTVTVGEYRRVQTTSPTISTNSFDWNSEVQFFDVAYGNGRFVAVGYLLWLGVIYTSTNGLDWENPIFGTPDMLRRVTFANGQFVAVGSQGVVMSSTNGLEWILRRGGTPAPLYSVAVANDRVFAAGGFYNTLGTLLSAASDGTWRFEDWTYPNYPTQLLPADEGFFAVGSGGIVSTSPDGYLWTHQSSATGQWLYDVIRASGYYVAVGNTGIERSLDGIHWTNSLVDPNKYFLSVTHGNGRFVAVGEAGAIMFSPDAITWQDADAGVSRTWRGVTFARDLFVAVGDAGAVLHSTNGTQWEFVQTQSTNALHGVRHLADRFIGLGAGGTILSSKDARSWQLHPSGVAEALYDATIAGNKIWVVGEGGTALRSEHDVLPRIKIADLGASTGCELVISGNLGRPSRVQWSNDLVTWEDWVAIQATVTNQTCLDFASTNQMRRFYRALAD